MTTVTDEELSASKYEEWTAQTTLITSCEDLFINSPSFTSNLLSEVTKNISKLTTDDYPSKETQHNLANTTTTLRILRNMCRCKKLCTLLLNKEKLSLFLETLFSNVILFLSKQVYNPSFETNRNDTMRAGLQVLCNLALHDGYSRLELEQLWGLVKKHLNRIVHAIPRDSRVLEPLFMLLDVYLRYHAKEEEEKESVLRDVWSLLGAVNAGEGDGWYRHWVERVKEAFAGKWGSLCVVMEERCDEEEEAEEMVGRVLENMLGKSERWVIEEEEMRVGGVVRDAVLGMKDILVGFVRCLKAKKKKKKKKEKRWRIREAENCERVFGVLENASLGWRCFVRGEEFRRECMRVYGEVMVEMVRELNRLGEEKVEQDEEKEEEEDVLRVLGMRRQVMCVLCHLCSGNKYCQDWMLQEKGSRIDLVLGMTKIDSHTQFLQQWAIFLIYNLCENNIRVQNYIGKMNFRKSVEGEELKKMGMHVVYDEVRGSVKIEKTEEEKNKKKEQ